MSKLNDKTFLRLLRQDMASALAGAGAKHGITFEVKAIRYDADGTGAKITVEANAPEADGTIKSKEEKDFERFHSLFHGLKPEHLHSTVRFGLQTYKIIGLRVNARKNPLLAEANGKRYCLPVSAAWGVK